jgi:glutamate dehydrogenase/leucine dehydrogenase
MRERLRRATRRALARVVNVAEQPDCDWRTAALSVAIERVDSAALARGISA